ncbi:unnamed protein product [Ilex paraguariensis]|uniref:Uncharacterized protein n=1 Tax=Ilex paraguariensis TaxID=185542 RepID=A0ABC8SG85_9AQUA
MSCLLCRSTKMFMKDDEEKCLRVVQITVVHGVSKLNERSTVQEGDTWRDVGPVGVRRTCSCTAWESMRCCKGVRVFDNACITGMVLEVVDLGFRLILTDGELGVACPARSPARSCHGMGHVFLVTNLENSRFTNSMPRMVEVQCS